MNNPDKKIKVTAIILVVSIAALIISAVAYNLLWRSGYGSVLDDSVVDEYLYNTLYIALFISIYAIGISFLVLLYLLVRRYTKRSSN